MKNRRISRTAMAGAAVLTLVTAASGCAKVAGSSNDEYPTHTVEMVVPYPAGGGTDAVARTLAEIVNKEGDLNSRVEVVNVEGGAGTVGTGKVLNADSDGYTLGFVPDGPLTLTPHVDDVSYDPEAYTPLVIPTQNPVLIAVAADSPYKTLDDLVEAAEQKPGSVTLGEGPLNYAAPVNLLEKEAGVSFKRVAFDGDAATTTALLGGNIDATITQLSGVQGQVDAGEIRILASTGAQPDEESLPGVPTMVDSGYDVTWSAYTFVMAPSGLDEEVTSTLTDVFSEAVASEGFADAVATLGVSRVDDANGTDARTAIQEKYDAASGALVESE